MLDTIVFLYLLAGSLNHPANTDVYDIVPVAKKTISLENRYPNEFVNGVFKDNILLTLNYMEGRVTQKSEISWPEIQKPQTFKFKLSPGESFAFHDQIMPEYDKNIVKTTNAHFNFSDGFKSDGFLMGDGVCHLASLIYWGAREAGLTVFAPTNHDFAKINEVPKEFGVSIYNLPGSVAVGARRNLYITNNFDKEVIFVFNYDGEDLSLDILKVSQNRI